MRPGIENGIGSETQMGETHGWAEVVCTHYLIINSKWFGF